MTDEAESMAYENTIQWLLDMKTYIGNTRYESLARVTQKIDQIIELLKKQKPMKPIYSEEKFVDHLPRCPVCKKVLPSISQYGKSNFCYRCGQAVKWE